MSGESREVFSSGKERQAVSAEALTRGRAEKKKRWRASPERLMADEADLGIIPQPEAKLGLRVNKVSGTSVKGWPHGSPGCSPARGGGVEQGSQ